MQIGDIVYYPFGRKEGVVIRIIDNNVVVAFPSGEQTLSNYSLEETGRQIPPCPVKAGDKIKFKTRDWREPLKDITKQGTVIDVSIYPTEYSMYRIAVATPMENGCLNEYQFLNENEITKIFKFR